MKKPVVISLHVLYWFIYTLLFSFVVFAYSIDVKDENGVPYAYSILTVGNITFLIAGFFVNSAVGFYTFYTVLFTKFLQRKKIVLLIAFGCLTGFVAQLASYVIIFIAFKTNIYSHGVAPGIVLMMWIIPMIHGGLGLVMRGFVLSYGDIRIKKELHKRNLEMELALIKTQINPHFLFNTINNIDVLIRKDAERASGYLNKLSDILRYMLYETKSDRVTFSKEVQNLENYLELQKIRTSNPDYIHYSMKGKVGDQLIAPMLFMPFIENAVKHAENKKTEKAITIRFDANDERIIFECSNAYSTGNAAKSLKGGLGKDLAQKRLDLLYPGQYQLDVHDHEGVYTVKLVLSLTP